MVAAARILTVPAAPRFSTVRLERKALHRFLVGYIASRALRPDPTLRSLLIAGIDVYPGPFPMRAGELEEHLDAVLRVKLPDGGWPRTRAALLP